MGSTRQKQVSGNRPHAPIKDPTPAMNAWLLQRAFDEALACLQQGAPDVAAKVLERYDHKIKVLNS